MLLHNVLICGLLLLGLLSLAEARRVCKDHSRHCRQLGDKRPRFHCYRKSTQERCCATCRNFENPSNQECLYGDKLAWCSSIGARYSAVSCYTHEVECCDACSKLSSDKIKDCPYGDREIWCPYFTKERCKDQASRSSCCETCHHLLHGDTVNTHGNKVVTETSTSTPTDAASPSSSAGGDRNSTNAPLVAVNTSHPVVPTEPNAASRATSVTILKVTENHTDVTGLMVKHRDNVGGDVTTTMISRPNTSGLPRTTESVTTNPSSSSSSPLPAQKETPRPTGASSTVGASGNSSRETSSSTVLSPGARASTSAAATSKDKSGNTTISRALPVDNNTRGVTSSSSSPTVTYKPGTGSSSRTVSLTSSSTSPSPSSSPSSSSSSSSSSPSSRVPTTSPPVVTELRIRLQETPSPSPGGNDTRVAASHSSYLPSLEDDEDYAQQASGDNDITIDEFTEERPTHEGGGHHHEGDHGHHNGNHHGGHHHKKGHHKNGVTAEVPYRYIPAEREDYMFEDYKSSSCRTAARWSTMLVPGLLITWSITGETWRRWVT